jgi:hypothetical protein
MDSMPDFHLRDNPQAPGAILKTVQVCWAAERGLQAVLDAQRDDTSDESLMEICVKRPVVMRKEMESAMLGIDRTVKHGKKKGEEWKK